MVITPGPTTLTRNRVFPVALPAFTFTLRALHLALAFSHFPLRSYLGMSSGIGTWHVFGGLSHFRMLSQKSSICWSSTSTHSLS